jgi:hypothetical protein
MTSFEEAQRIARKELQRSQNAAERAKDDGSAEQQKNGATARRVGELVLQVTNEARVITDAMRHIRDAKLYRAVPWDVAVKSRKYIPGPSMNGGSRGQFWVNLGYKRMEKMRAANSFWVWDLDSEWSYTEPDEPYETTSQHYFLSTDGAILHSRYFTEESYKSNGEFVITNELNPNFDYTEDKLMSVRIGLAKLSLVHELDLSL